MTKAVAKAPARELVHPFTGEVIPLDAPTDLLGKALDEQRAVEAEERTFKRALMDEIISRMDKEGTWTYNPEGAEVKLTAPSPGRTVYVEPECLRSDLLQLANKGVISKEAAERAVTTEVVYKPVAQQLKNLAKLGGKVKEVIDQYTRPDESSRSVTVTPKERLT